MGRGKWGFLSPAPLFFPSPLPLAPATQAKVYVTKFFPISQRQCPILSALSNYLVVAMATLSRINSKPWVETNRPAASKYFFFQQFGEFSTTIISYVFLAKRRRHLGTDSCFWTGTNYQWKILSKIIYLNIFLFSL